MRIDKYLKVSRLIKRRTVATEACSSGRITINDKVVKPSAEVKEGDIITIGFGGKQTKVRVKKVVEFIKAEEADTMYEAVE
ncbi:MAG: RNA-binding S4 domain-containing protein [Clostridia bacterium]|nr:RNA-binding S4 domain-containing protein [Clostridia bacterium]